jgi:hypothetical protein
VTVIRIQCFSFGSRGAVGGDIVVLCHTFFPLSQDELAASASFFGNALSHHLPSRVKTKSLNPQHRHRLSSPDRLTHIHFFHHSITSLFYLHPRQSTTLSKTPLTVIVPYHCCLTPIIHPYNDTHIDELADPLSLLE